jgi:hypothetical protein
MNRALSFAVVAIISVMIGRASNPRATIEDVVCDRQSHTLTSCLIYQSGHETPVYFLEIDTTH